MPPDASVPGSRLGTRRWFALAAAFACTPFLVAAQGSSDYRAKAEFLLNFVRYVEWPSPANMESLTLCVAGQNPFGQRVIEEVLRGQRIGDRVLDARVILEPEANCQVVFIPRSANRSAYLQAATGTPTLLIGETPDFLSEGGMIAFVTEGDDLRFDVNVEAAERVGLTISSRLLRLAASQRPAPK